MIEAVKWAMTLATVLFVAGYLFRFAKNAAHRWLMMAGAMTVALAAIGLVAGVHLLGREYRSAGWLETTVGLGPAQDIMLAHRLLATLAFFLLAAQLLSGLRRQQACHQRISRLFFPCWWATYLSGLAVFS